MYDGYHFCADAAGVYNPFSLLNALQDKQFNDYWFETGTPSFLVNLIKNTTYDISSLQGEEVDSSLLISVNTAFANPIPLLYQSGYLTITGYDREVGLYRLDFPNREVKNGFLCLSCSTALPRQSPARHWLQRFIVLCATVGPMT